MKKTLAVFVALAAAYTLTLPACFLRAPPAEPIIVGKATCSQACENVRALCAETYLTPKTGTCFDACSNAEAHGMDFRTTCLANARGGCDAARSCSAR